jgi:flagellar basal body-associated protein FliL
MAFLLCAGTVYGLLRNPQSGPLFSLGAPEAALPAPESAARAPSQAWGTDAEGLYPDGIFTGIGRLRISLEPQPAAAVLSVVFPYPAEDRAFSEELAARLPELRQITSDYFKGFSADELRRADETTLKTGVLARYNQLLRLGKIEEVYFNDFVILD